MSNRESWAYLSRVVEGPSKPLQELLKAGRDADEIAAGVRARASWLGGLGPATASRYKWDRPAEDLATAQRFGARLVTPEDEEWPREQLNLAFGFAASGLSPHLRTYQDDAAPPHALWVKGAPLKSLLAQAVGIVGTRTASRYAERATQTITQGLAAHQWTIISGGALGVDTVAHETALHAGAPTVVVAACGVDQNYPRANTGLFSRIVAAGGGIISEYPPGVTPQRHRFLTRNRLVAAFSGGVVLMQAPWRSGALNTMSWAEGLGRVAMAVPGPITTNDFVGSHNRIQEGRAQLVASADDIRALLSPVGALDPNEQYELAFAADPIQSLSRNELRVYDALPRMGSVDIDHIASTAGLTIALTVHLLLELEQRSLIVREGTQWRRFKQS